MRTHYNIRLTNLEQIDESSYDDDDDESSSELSSIDDDPSFELS